MPLVDFNIEQVVGDPGEAGLQSLDPDQFGVAPEQVSCQSHVDQYCLVANERCYITENGVKALTPEGFQEFNQSYPDCREFVQSLSGATKQPSDNQKPKMMKKEFFDINSPNFLGGNNMHNVIIIALLLFVLATMTRKNALAAVAKGAKEAVGA